MALSKQLNLGWNHATPRLLRSTEILKLCRCLTRSASNVQTQPRNCLRLSHRIIISGTRLRKREYNAAISFTWEGPFWKFSPSQKHKVKNAPWDRLFQMKTSCALDLSCELSNESTRKMKTVIAVEFVALGKGFLACSAQATNRFSCLLCTGTHWWIDAPLCAGSFFLLCFGDGQNPARFRRKLTKNWKKSIENKQENADRILRREICNAMPTYKPDRIFW